LYLHWIQSLRHGLAPVALGKERGSTKSNFSLRRCRI